MSDIAASSGARRDYELADVLDVDTPERLKALGDPLRSHICDIVLERAMTVTELAERVGRPRGSVAYHVDVLVEAGLLQVTHTRQVRAIEERFYGRAARTYLLPDTPGDQPLLREMVAEYDEEAARRLADEHRDGGGCETVGPVFTTYRRVRIPPTRAAEYSRRLNELLLEFVDEERGGDVEFGCFVSLFPTNRTARIPAEPGDHPAEHPPEQPPEHEEPT